MPSPKYNELMRLMRSADPHALVVLMDDPTVAPHLNAPDAQGHFLLHRAVHRGTEAVVAALLQRQVDPNARHVGPRAKHAGEQALHKVAKPGIAPLLLAYGAVVDGRDDQGNTPLHRMAAGGHDAVLQELLAAGASVEAQNNQGETPMTFALRMGRLTTTTLLLAQGATVPEDGLLTVVHNTSASQPVYERLLRLLLERGASPHQIDSEGNTPLHWVFPLGVRGAQAVGGNQAYEYGMLRALLEAGANPNTPNHRGETPLHPMAYVGNAMGVQLLLEAGADATLCTEQGGTALDGCRENPNTYDAAARQRTEALLSKALLAPTLAAEASVKACGRPRM